MAEYLPQLFLGKDEEVPKTKEDWNKLLNEVAKVSFFQGINWVLKDIYSIVVNQVNMAFQANILIQQFYKEYPELVDKKDTVQKEYMKLLKSFPDETVEDILYGSTNHDSLVEIVRGKV